MIILNNNRLYENPYIYNRDTLYQPYYRGYNYVRCYDYSGEQAHSNSPKQSYTTDEALAIAKALDIDFSKAQFDVEQFRMGLDVELEHGLICPHTNVTSDNPLLTGKIALAHLFEMPDYYTRLKILEEEGNNYWQGKQIYKNC